jgi:hypothetical protein
MEKWMALGKRLTEQQGPPESQVAIRTDRPENETTFQMLEKTNKDAKRQRKAEVRYDLFSRGKKSVQRSKTSSRGWLSIRPDQKRAARSEP